MEFFFPQSPVFGASRPKQGIGGKKIPFIYKKDDPQSMTHFSAKFLKQSCNAKHNILLRKLIKTIYEEGKKKIYIYIYI